MRVIRDSGTGSVSRVSSKRAEARDSRAALPFESIKIAARIIDPAAFRRRREKERSNGGDCVDARPEDLLSRYVAEIGFSIFDFRLDGAALLQQKKGQFYRDSTIRRPFHIILTLCSVITRFDQLEMHHLDRRVQYLFMFDFF